MVTDFLDALGRGDVEAAASKVGPVSSERADMAGGLDSMLHAATEGHGAWADATGRVVTPIGVAPGVAVVVLEGTLQVEGSTEHRVAAFPARKAESADAWFVDPWAYDLASGAPLRIESPAIDEEEWATVPSGASRDVTVGAASAGTVWASFDGRRPEERQIAAGGAVTFTPDGVGPGARHGRLLGWTRARRFGVRLPQRLIASRPVLVAGARWEWLPVGRSPIPGADGARRRSRRSSLRGRGAHHTVAIRPATWAVESRSGRPGRAQQRGPGSSSPAAGVPADGSLR